MAYRSALAAGLLVLAVGPSIPGTVIQDLRRLHSRETLSVEKAEASAPYFHYGTRYPENNWSLRLVLAARRRVPADAVIGMRARYLTTWARDAAFGLAPRRLVAGLDAPWVILIRESPEEAGLAPRRAWRLRTRWLVER